LGTVSAAIPWLTAAVANTVAPSVNSTLPVGLAVVVEATAAENAIDSQAVAGFVFAFTVVVEAFLAAAATLMDRLTGPVAA
jgi:hypothetical protein